MIDGTGVNNTTPTYIPPTPAPPTIEITISAPKIEIYEVGSTARVTCSARSVIGRGPVQVHWQKDGGILPNHAIDDGRGLLVITNLKVSDSGRYICKASDGFTIVTQDINVNVGSKSVSVCIEGLTTAELCTKDFL